MCAYLLYFVQIIYVKHPPGLICKSKMDVRNKEDVRKDVLYFSHKEGGGGWIGVL